MNNFYTLLVIPEKTKQVKKFIVPAVYLRIATILGSVALFFVAFMVYDYVNVMQQIAESKRLQTENRELKQQMQSYTTKLQNVEDTLERIQSYATKLRIITNQAGESTENLKKKIAPDIPGMPMDDHSDQSGGKNPQPGSSGGALDPALLPTRWLEKLGKSELLASNNFSDAVRVATEQSEKESKHKDLTEQQKKISDLIREDEERESDSLKRDFDKLNQAFSSVLQHAQGVELDIQALSSVLVDQHDYLESMPTLKPTSGWYTSGFGVRNSPFTGHSTMHEGLDIANNIGSPINAPAAGIVTYAGARPGYGNLITVDHGYGLQTQYGHVSRSYVHVGQKVKRGDRLGAVGNVGRSTGPHLHYEVRVNGIPVDPYYYILQD